MEIGMLNPGCVKNFVDSCGWFQSTFGRLEYYFVAPGNRLISQVASNS